MPIDYLAKDRILHGTHIFHLTVALPDYNP